MNFESSVVKIKTICMIVDYNHPLNLFNTAEYSGSGFFFHKKKYILTCYHVVKGAFDIKIDYKQKYNINAKVKYIYPHDDMAILEITDNIDDIIDDIKILKIDIITNNNNQDVYIVGFPLDSNSIKITNGIISGFQNSYIQTNATMNGGNSGGPLILKSSNKVIGVNAAKLVKGVENTGYAIPLYRFLLFWNNSKTINTKTLFTKKFTYQTSIQEELSSNIYSGIKERGVIITSVNKDSNISSVLKPNEILLSINNNNIDKYGFIKFDFFPNKILLDDLYTWFVENDTIILEVYSLEKKIEKRPLLLKNEQLLLEYHPLISKYPYYYENSGLILSIITTGHLNNLFDELELTMKQKIKIAARNIGKNLFTVYLADLNYNIIKFKSYPVGDIIVKINETKFTNIDEFRLLLKNPIKSFRTIDNKIFFV